MKDVYFLIAVKIFVWRPNISIAIILLGICPCTQKNPTKKREIPEK